MKNSTVTLLLSLAVINICNASLIITNKAITLARGNLFKTSSHFSNLKEKITQSIPKDLSPKTIDSKKALAFSTASAAIDPAFALGSALAISTYSVANQIGINYFNQPKPEDKAILNPENIKSFELSSYLQAIKNPFQTADKRAKLGAKRPETLFIGKISFNDIKNIAKKTFPLGVSTGITANSLATNLGTSVLDGYTFGANTIGLYLFSKIIFHLKNTYKEQQELEEPENLAQLAQEFNKTDSLINESTNNSLVTIENQEKK